jgi:hypothetical protein
LRKGIDVLVCFLVKVVVCKCEDVCTIEDASFARKYRTMKTVKLL